MSRSPRGPFKEIEPRWIDYYPFDPDYHDVNLIMDATQKKPPTSQAEGRKAPKGTFIPAIDPNIYFDPYDNGVYLYFSRNAYRNWNWDPQREKYVEESNILGVKLERTWWDDVDAKTMPAIVSSERDRHRKRAQPLPSNIRAYNGTGEIGHPPRMDGWKTLVSYGEDPQDWCVCGQGSSFFGSECEYISFHFPADENLLDAGKTRM